MRRSGANVDYMGYVTFDLHGEIELNMNMVVSNYPYDTQNVTMILSSWSHTADEVFLYPYGETPMTKAQYHFSEDIAWIITDWVVSN